MAVSFAVVPRMVDLVSDSLSLIPMNDTTYPPKRDSLLSRNCFCGVLIADTKFPYDCSQFSMINFLYGCDFHAFVYTQTGYEMTESFDFRGVRAYGDARRASYKYGGVNERMGMREHAEHF
jgi:hypothetical protein